MKKLERSLKAVANRRRLGILKYLKAQGKAPVAEIAAEIDLSFKATSKHLSVLAAADIVEKDQVGLQMFYRISAIQTPAIKSIISLL